MFLCIITLLSCFSVLRSSETHLQASCSDGPCDTSANIESGTAHDVFLQEDSDLFLLQFKSVEKRANESIIGEDFKAHEPSALTGDPDQLKLVPEKSVVFCSCAKCGSTSMYKFVYSSLFGKDWRWKNQPYVHSISPRWKGKVKIIDANSASDLMGTSNAFSIALVRDPRERLISSWKSKVACDAKCWHTDVFDRPQLVRGLLRLAGNIDGLECLSFSEYVQTLHTIHLFGKAEFLDPHFLPQNLACLKDIPFQKWSMVAKADDPQAAKELAAHLGGTNSSFPQTHSSGQDCMEPISGIDIVDKLNEITQMEYATLHMNPGLHNDISWLEQALGKPSM